mmetsp:Transcript_35014/g.57944  ORF Transcript_35014/g.57944 Transcript_35014/m.57944 type:complete len:137 (+) Transcript_35014:169-579(+)
MCKSSTNSFDNVCPLMSLLVRTLRATSVAWLFISKLSNSRCCTVCNCSHTIGAVFMKAKRCSWLCVAHSCATIFRPSLLETVFLSAAWSAAIHCAQEEYPILGCCLSFFQCVFPGLGAHLFCKLFEVSGGIKILNL